VDPIVRGHLLDQKRFSPPIHRFAPDHELTDVIRRFWVPVWSLPSGVESVQRVLQYPCCQLVVAPNYARLVGPRVGMSTQTLSGDGWAFGVMLQPAVGAQLLGAEMRTLVDQDVDLADLTTLLNPADTIANIRELLAPDPSAKDAHLTAGGLVAKALRPFVPMDAEGVLVNQLAEHVEGNQFLRRVDELALWAGLSVRSLERICGRRIGLTPKWIIQRNRLHHVAQVMIHHNSVILSDLAGEAGYADQAHFSRDFKRVVGVTPALFSPNGAPDPPLNLALGQHRGHQALPSGPL
jgi:AraC-like DNA-binding protein